jgi:hypothetical protein
MNDVNVYSKKFWTNTFIGYLFVGLVIGFILSLLNVLRVIPVVINEIEYYGIGYSIILLLYIAMFSFIFAILNWLVVMAGFTLYKWIKSIIRNKV